MQYRCSRATIHLKINVQAQRSTHASCTLFAAIRGAKSNAKRALHYRVFSSGRQKDVEISLHLCAWWSKNLHQSIPRRKWPKLLCAPQSGSRAQELLSKQGLMLLSIKDRASHIIIRMHNIHIHLKWNIKVASTHWEPTFNRLCNWNVLGTKYSHALLSAKSLCKMPYTVCWYSMSCFCYSQPYSNLHQAWKRFCLVNQRTATREDWGV